MVISELRLSHLLSYLIQHNTVKGQRVDLLHFYHTLAYMVMKKKWNASRINMDTYVEY